MRFTMPEPPHGWRDLAWEIAIVFIGVVLALGGERVIQNLNWRQDARQASAAIKAELAEHRLAALERLAIQPCLKGQLKALHDKLSAHRTGMWTGMPMYVAQESTTGAQMRVLGVAYRSPEPPWVDEAWQLARSTGALSHLPNDEVAKYARVYRLSAHYVEFQIEENAAAARLSVLARDGPIDPESRIELLGALAQIDHVNAYLELGARQQLESLGPLLGSLPRSEVDKAVADRMAAQQSLRGPCVTPLRLRRT